DINHLINDTCKLIENRLADDGITIYKEHNPVPQIEANYTEISQVITNILLNSRDAIKETYNEAQRQGTIRIKTYEQDDTVIIETTDDGCGIAEADLAKVYDPFFTTKDIGKGTGLGLYVVQQIIGRHGGSVNVSSKVAEGTTITIKLPITKHGN
ncbi:MAG: HAMP domain-containing sensor histidine kinase, partial [Candidatus Omnitrophota bacterium]